MKNGRRKYNKYSIFHAQSKNSEHGVESDILR